MENSKIEWTDHTFNPWIGCQHVSPGCDHCYAETQNAFRKWNGGTWGPHAPRERTADVTWRSPSSGMQKLANLDGSTAIGRVCSVRLLPTCSIIKLLQIGAKTCSH